MKKIQIITIAGVLYCCTFNASEEAFSSELENSSFRGEVSPKPKAKKKKNKNGISLAFQVCINALEETFKDLLNKEISHILSQLPKWIDRLGSRAIVVGDGEFAMTSDNILSVLEFVKKSCNVNRFFDKPNSYIKKIWHYDSKEERLNYLATILFSYDESLLFFDELFYVLSASLKPLQQQNVEGYYHSFSEKDDEAKES